MTTSTVLIPISTMWTFYILPITVLSLFTAIANEDDPCQKGKTIGLYLSEWLSMAGFIDVMILSTYWTFAMVEYLYSTELASVCYAMSVYMSILMQITIRIIGIVIISTQNNSSCISKDLGIATIANIVICCLSCFLGFRNTFIETYRHARLVNNNNVNDSFA